MKIKIISEGSGKTTKVMTEDGQIIQNVSEIEIIPFGPKDLEDLVKARITVVCPVLEMTAEMETTKEEDND